MCSICGQYPCAPSCPNAPAKPCPFKCAYCGEGIEIGESYYTFHKRKYHKECVWDMTADEWIKEFDVDLDENTATKDDF